MNNLLKGILLSVGVIVTCSLIVLGIYYSNESENISKNNDLNEQTSDFDEVAKQSYDNTAVSGYEAINAIDKYAKDDDVVIRILHRGGDVDLYGVPGVSYCKDVYDYQDGIETTIVSVTSKYYDDKQDANSNMFINTGAKYYATVRRNADNVITLITFRQEGADEDLENYGHVRPSHRVSNVTPSKPVINDYTTSDDSDDSGSTGGSSGSTTGTYNYTVNHYQMKLDGKTYTLVETDKLTSNSLSVTPSTKDYTGFTAPVKRTVTISADGKTEIDYYYTRNQYWLNLNLQIDGKLITSGITQINADLYVNGVEYATNFNDLRASLYYDSSYKIKDVVVASGYTYHGCIENSKYSGLTGNINEYYFNPGVTYQGAEVVTVVLRLTTNKYTVEYNANGGTGTMESSQHTYDVEQALNENKFTRKGYVFAGWSTEKNGTVQYQDKEVVKNLSGGSNDVVTLYAVWEPKAVEYTVNHYQMDLDDESSYTLVKTEKLTGHTDQKLTPSTKNYEGFTSPKEVTITLEYEGTNKVDYYYTRNSYKLTLTKTSGISSITSGGTYKYGQSVTINAEVENGYTWSGWNGSTSYSKQKVTFNMPASDTSLKANATLNSYEITYNLNGGSVSKDNPESYTILTESFTLNNPSRAGYKFTGWTGSNGTTPSKEVTITKGSTGDLEYNANYEEYSLTLEYYSNYATSGYTTVSGNNDLIKTTVLKYSTGNITIPKWLSSSDDMYLERVGYNGSGYWGTEESNGELVLGGTSFDSVEKLANALGVSINETNATVKLYPQWSKNTYTVKYNGNGSTSGTMSDSSYSYGEVKALTENVFSKLGYTFTGWNTKTDGSGQSYSDKQEVSNLITTNNGTVNLYAQWVANSDTPYTVKHYKMDKDGINYTLEETENLKGSTDSEVTPAVKSYEGFTAPATQSVVINADGTSLVEYYYTRNTYLFDIKGRYNNTTIENTTGYATFDVYIDGTLMKSGVSDYSKSCYYGTTFEIKNITVNPGYTYMGVYSGALSGTVTKYDPTILEFSVNSYIINYNGNGSTSGSMNPVTVAYTDEVTLTANAFVKSGNTFTGWNTASDGSGTSYVDKATVSKLVSTSGGQITLYAQWTPNIYKVTLDNQSATSAGTTEAYYIYNTAKVIDGVTVYQYADSACTTPLTDGYYINVPKKTGYTFQGYYTGKNGTGTQHVNVNGAFVNNMYQQPSNTTLYAYWVINEYTINYNGNGSTSGTVSSATYKFGEDVTIAANTYLKTGYNFVGWNTKADGSGTSYTADETVETLSSVAGDIITLYAQWEIKVITLTIDGNGGSRNDGSTTEVVTVERNYGKTESIQERKRNGYILTGYVITNTATGSTTDIGGATVTFDSSTKTASCVIGDVNITLTAQWFGIENISIGDYVSYSANSYSSWRVMYNNSGQLDIISAGSTTTKTLTGESDYKNAAGILNELAKTYINSTYASSARCLGYSSATVEYITDTFDYDSTGSPFEDSNYKSDVNHLTANGLVQSDTAVWLASRTIEGWSSNVFTGNFGTEGHVRYLNTDGSTSSTYLHDSAYNHDHDDNYSRTYGFRPVVNLKSGLGISGGSGTAADPWVISQ